MSFEITQIGGFNPFEWEDLKCPVCEKSEYVSLSHTAVYCESCNARFVVRMTGGDPGCVIDCHVENIYAPAWSCKSCGHRFGSFDPKPVCPTNAHHTDCVREKFISRSWDRPNSYPKRWCLILKLGDYCSSWMNGDNSSRLNHPTEKQWEEFQAALEEIKPGLGSTEHARYRIITKGGVGAKILTEES